MWYIIFSCLLAVSNCNVGEGNKLAIPIDPRLPQTKEMCLLHGELTLDLLEREGHAGKLLKYHCEWRPKNEI
jgi:hypothetical protein